MAGLQVGGPLGNTYGAPAGYTYDPVKGTYSQAPIAQGANGLTPAMSALLSPQEHLAQGNTEAAQKLAQSNATASQTQAANELKARQAEEARQAQQASQSEADRVHQAEADRASQTSNLSLSANLADTNAAKASERSQAARANLIGQIPSLMGSLTGDTATPAGAPATGVDAAQAARDTAFARAKDKIGQIQRGAMTSLREGLSGRGLAGGGLESSSMASLLGEGQGQLSDVVSGQMTSEANRANTVADQNKQNAITRRGQNIGVGQSILSLLGSSAY